MFFKRNGFVMSRFLGSLLVTSILVSQSTQVFAAAQLQRPADDLFTPHSVTHAIVEKAKPTTQEHLDAYVAARKAAAEKARKLASWEEIDSNDPHYYAKRAYTLSSGIVSLGAEIMMPWALSAGLRVSTDILLGVSAPYILNFVGGSASSVVSEIPYAPAWLARLSSALAQGETMRHFGTLASAVDANIVPVSYSLWGVAGATYNLGSHAVSRMLGLAENGTSEKVELEALSGRFRLDGQRAFTQDELDEYFAYTLRREAYDAKVAAWEVIEDQDSSKYLKQAYNASATLGGAALKVAAPFLTKGAIRVADDVVIATVAPKALAVIGSVSQVIGSSVISKLPLGSHVSGSFGKFASVVTQGEAMRHISTVGKFMDKNAIPVAKTTASALRSGWNWLRSKTSSQGKVAPAA